MELAWRTSSRSFRGSTTCPDDGEVSEVMINGPAAVFVKRGGRMAALDAPGLTAEAVARAAVQIARPLGKDPLAEPIIDARLADGSRVAICSPPAVPQFCDHHPALRWQNLHRRGADSKRIVAGPGGRGDRGGAPARAQQC